MTKSIRNAAFAVIGSLSIVSAAGAAAIAVPNGDFESDGRTNTSGLGQINGASTGWARTSAGGAVGVFDLTATGGFFNAVDTSSNGRYVGFTQGVGTTYSNTLATTFAANTTYTLSMLVGHSYEPAAGPFTVAIADGTTGLVLASTTGAFPGSAGVTATVTLDSTTAGVVIGNPIRVSFIAGAAGSQVFDNVTLDGTSNAVPEPATLSLVGLTALGALRRRRSV